MKFAYKHILFPILLFSLAFPAFGETQNYSLRFQSRTALHIDGGDAMLNCDYLNIYSTGNFTENFSYVFRNRFDKNFKTGDIINATEFLFFTYRLKDWEFKLGKMPVENGGYEYDATPLNLYYTSEYWDNYGTAFNYAASVGRHFGRHTLTIQLARSPLGDQSKFFSGRFGYSLGWTGSFGCYESRWSVNFFELAEKGKFASFQVFGNKFDFNPVCVKLDLFHRLSCSNPTLFKDFSAVCQADWEVSQLLNVFVKATYDKNTSDLETLVAIGTDVFRVGGGFEVFPISGKKNFRIHCAYYHDGMSHFVTGLTLDVDVLKR